LASSDEPASGEVCAVAVAATLQLWIRPPSPAVTSEAPPDPVAPLLS
jgi:hypothetical protein